ncbi:MAG: RNase adapter RapZ [Burkholderiaceae bacterium]|nr:RNase adapter RapZ [Burkholderiaceae bacterium]
MRLVLVSGMSGSGKSVAIRLLEDLGYYCIDNLPSQFLADVCAFLSGSGHLEVAVSVDARSEGPIAQLPGMLSVLRSLGYDVRMLFLTASTEALVQRFSETRRRHPLSRALSVAGREATLEESIAQERDRLAPIDSLGHVIDTSGLPPATLRQWVRSFVDGPRSDLTLAFESFAYKNGIPVAADLVFDVRNLPNPHYDPKLRPLTGLDAPVAKMLSSLPEARAMIDDIAGFITRWLPGYVQDGRNYLTVAVGCTGGQHRSPYVVEQLALRFGGNERVLVRHRMLESVTGR